MKVAILFLFAFVAVSQAAFTANLVQRAAPIIAKTFSQARLRTDDGLQTTLFQSLSAQLTALAEQIQSGIDSGVAVAQSVYDSFNETLEQLQNLGSNAWEAASSIISNLFGNLFGGLFGGNKRALDLSTITNVLSGLGLDNILGTLFNHVVNLISQLQMPAFIENALSALLSNDVVQQVMSALFGRQRGLFGDLISGLSGAVSGFASQIAGFVGSIQDQLASGLASIAEIATQILGEAQGQVMQITQQAAQELIAQLAPYAQDMGAAFDQIVAAIHTLVGSN